MNKYKGVMQRFLEAAEKTGDATLRWQYQKEMMKENYLSEREIDRVADKVISRISATVDVEDIIQQIEELRKELEKLYIICK